MYMHCIHVYVYMYVCRDVLLEVVFLESVELWVVGDGEQKASQRTQQSKYIPNDDREWGNE